MGDMTMFKQPLMILKMLFRMEDKNTTKILSK